LRPRKRGYKVNCSHGCLLRRRLWLGHVRCLPTGRCPLVVCYFVFFFFCFLYRACLPFSIFGKSFRTRSISFSLQACTFRLPKWTVFGAGTLFLAIYRLSVPALMPSLLAASRVEITFIPTTSVADSLRKSQGAKLKPFCGLLGSKKLRADKRHRGTSRPAAHTVPSARHRCALKSELTSCCTSCSDYRIPANMPSSSGDAALEF
jgi:hypothetical protein